jgi:hypothetical protein
MAPDEELGPEAFNDDDDEAAMARLREAEKRLRNTPPRCLAGFKVEPATLTGVALDGHGSGLNKIYKLSCTCANDRFRVLGHHVKSEQGGTVFVSPLALECALCGVVMELIDTDQHGYDAELGHGSATIRGDGPRTPFACDTCGVRPITAFARFEHSGEELADSFIEEFPNSQDYFSWFSLVGRCEGCKRLLNVADFECA